MQEYNYNGKLIIGVDHGYGNMKTAHRVFKTGIDELAEAPIVSENYLVYGGKYYVIGESHLTYQGDKTETEEFFLLTLAAIGEELAFRGRTQANIYLAVGLPLAWAKSQGKAFKEYLLQKQDLVFEYRKQRYEVHICDVAMFPQGFAAICQCGRMEGFNMIVDIGNGTMNIMQIHNGKPLEKSLITEKYGVSCCIKEIQHELTKNYTDEVPEEMIEPLLRGNKSNSSKRILDVTETIATRYANEIMKRLVSYGYKEELMNLYVIGGGGCLLKNYTDVVDKEGVFFIDDICANAKGYEYLAMQKMKRAEKG